MTVLELPFPPEARKSCIRLALWVHNSLQMGKSPAWITMQVNLSPRMFGHLRWVGALPSEIITLLLRANLSTRSLCGKIASRRKFYSANNYEELKRCLQGETGKTKRQKASPLQNDASAQGKYRVSKQECSLVESELRERLTAAYVRAQPLATGGVRITIDIGSLADIEDFLSRFRDAER